MTNSTEIAIKISSLSKVYQKRTKEGKQEDFHALKNINLEVKKGEVLGIIGKNGSGKSTLLKILSGVTKPSSGLIEINGTVSSILDVGTGFHPDLSGRENVYLRGELLGMNRKEIGEAYNEIVAFSEIEDFIETPIKNYSSGMFLRLAFSVAIHLNADIIILDEVISVGDAKFQNKCFQKIKKLSETKNATIVIVSHDVARLNTLISKLTFIANGEIRLFDSKEAAFNAYMDPTENKEFSYKESVKIYNENKVECIKFTNNEAIVFNIQNVKKLSKGDFVSLRFNDVFNNVVFITSPFFSKNNSFNFSNVKDTLSFTIPTYFFNKGMFHIDLIYSNNEKIIDTIYNIAHFTIELEESLKNIKLYGESGALKPYFEWKEE